MRKQKDVASDNDSIEQWSICSDTTSDDDGSYLEDDHEDHKSILKAAAFVIQFRFTRMLKNPMELNCLESSFRRTYN